jgi:hypothetical protein
MFDLLISSEVVMPLLNELSIDATISISFLFANHPSPLGAPARVLRVKMS